MYQNEYCDLIISRLQYEHAVTSGRYVIILYNHEKIMHAYYSFQNTITQIHREMRKLHYIGHDTLHIRKKKQHSRVRVFLDFVSRNYFNLLPANI